MTARAVVFAYHNVGAVGLRSLVANGIDVVLVVTHHDNPVEAIWFERVSEVAGSLGLPWIAPDNPNAPDIVARIKALAPDFLFSFYYRQMLGAELLALPTHGALNLHGSLLPKYRGRVPVNWAVLNGETQTGVTLHDMAAKPDAGDIVAQRAVPIGPDDTAKIVFDRITAASALLLDDVLPQLVAGTATRRTNDLAQGSYFGGRKPEDGRIDFTQPAATIHNLVRAVAPPYPGAFTDVAGLRVRVLATGREVPAQVRTANHAPGLFVADGKLYLAGGDGGVIAVLAADCDGAPLGAVDFSALVRTTKHS